MGYYTRILGTQDVNIHLEKLLDALLKAGLSAQLEIDKTEQPNQWSFLHIENENGEALAQLERNPVIDGGLGKEELEELKEEIKEYKPTSAVEWLIKYFEKVNVIYAFQLLAAAFDDENFVIIDCIRSAIWKNTGGLIQADGEGFSNEEGYLILWQFSDNATGEWNCAVRDVFGQWQKFTMELGDEKQRAEFKNGELPKKAIRL